MSASNIAIDPPPGEHAPAWMLPMALVLGVTSWLGVGFELSVAAPHAGVDETSAPVFTPLAAMPSSAVDAAAPQPRAPGPARSVAAPEVVAPRADASATACAPVIGFSFAQGGATPAAIEDGIDAAIRFAQSHPEQPIAVEGYASAEGSPEVNLRLSHERAQVVAKRLEKRGLAADRVVVQAYGEYRPSLQGRGSDEDRRVIVRFPGPPECPQETPP